MIGFERYGMKTSEKANIYIYICIMSTGLPRPGLAHSAHRGRIKLLRGYVCKSSTALTLTITQLACSCKRYVHVGTRSLTDLRVPAHQLAVRMRIIIVSKVSWGVLPRKLLMRYYVFFACWHAYVLQVHTRLQVGLDY